MRSSYPRPVPTSIPESWKLGADEVARMAGTDVHLGLSMDEAGRRLEETGPNRLEGRERRPAWLVFLSQFASTMIVVLLVAAAITAALGDVQDTIAIAAVVLLNGIVGFVQEYRAEGAMTALQRMTSPRSEVVRDGVRRTVTAPDLVPGDVVLLAAGDVVGADLRLVEAAALRVNEAPLTGESEPVAKSTAALPSGNGEMVVDQRNMAFSGTAVTYGRGSGVVVATGMATEIGKIASLLQQHGADRTPLQRRLASLGRLLATAALALTAIVFIGGVALGEPVDTMFLTAVSLAVSAIPEGLPIMVTVALALGARRMAARHALVRTLPTVETLGSVDVICSDKTGTLTENRMLVERVWTPEATYGVSGSGYAPDGAVTPLGDASTRGTDPALDALADVAVACNDAQLHPPTEAGRGWTITGDPTEGALLSFAGKLGVFREELGERAPRVDELAFDADRRRMTTVQTLGGGLSWVATKGAVEAIADGLHPEDAVVADEARRAGDAMAADGYRVLAFAEKRVPTPELDLDHAEEGLTLLGLVGMADPPRSDVGASIQTCADAGICPVMITGDDPRTASAIAGRLGILDGCREVVTGAELAELDDAALAERADTIRVYARTDPEQKLRIVNAWKGRDKVVAMTGDGVNDAPALRRADIGVAMGITGTEVSREAADMVLADDDFSTIVVAVEEGRRIYDNIRHFLRYMLATNSGELWLFFLALAFALPIPLLPLQILWVNLLTDGLPSIALGVEPAERDTMDRPPRPLGEPIWGGGLWQQTVWLGLLMGIVSVGMQMWARDAGLPWQTMVFTTISFLQLGNALTARSDRVSAFRLGVRSNPWLFAAVGSAIAAQLLVVYVPWLQGVFDTEPLNAFELGVVLFASSAAFVAVEIQKAVRRAR